MRVNEGREWRQINADVAGCGNGMQIRLNAFESRLLLGPVSGRLMANDCQTASNIDPRSGVGPLRRTDLS